jgi:VanZ family protein
MNYFALFVKKTLRFLLKPLSFLPAILVAAMIFNFSAADADESTIESRSVTEEIVHSINYRLEMNWTPSQQEQYVESLEFYVRKAAHFSEYCLLAVTLAIPLYVYGVRGIRLLLLTTLICAAYACTDEYHQTFSLGRSPSFRDVCIDTSGAILGVLLSHPILWFFRVTVFRPLSLERERRMREEYYDRREGRSRKR